MNRSIVNRTPRATILVVDDEAGPRDALKAILRPFFHVLSAGTGTEALQILNAQSIDLVTLDQKLPDGDGLDLLKAIKERDANIEVVIITGYGSVQSAMEGLRLGAAGYLLKPFNATELVTLVQHMFEKKRRLEFLRGVLRSSPELWGAEQDSSQAWRELRSAYAQFNVHREGSTLHRSDVDCLSLLSDMLEAADRSLLTHSSRVSYYSSLLGSRLDLTTQQQQSLAVGAFLHDIGMALPISSKLPEPKSWISDAGDSYRSHTLIGARLIHPLGFPAEVSQIVSYHHERWDGSGYPYGLQGNGIPLVARIVSLTQAFDRLMTANHVSPSRTIEEALADIASKSGTYFDPMLTNMFIEILRQTKIPDPSAAGLTAGALPEILSLSAAETTSQSLE